MRRLYPPFAVSTLSTLSASTDVSATRATSSARRLHSINETMTAFRRVHLLLLCQFAAAHAVTVAASVSVSGFGIPLHAAAATP